MEFKVSVVEQASFVSYLVGDSDDYLFLATEVTLLSPLAFLGSDDHFVESEAIRGNSSVFIDGAVY